MVRGEGGGRGGNLFCRAAAGRGGGLPLLLPDDDDIEKEDPNDPDYEET